MTGQGPILQSLVFQVFYILWIKLTSLCNVTLISGSTYQSPTDFTDQMGSLLHRWSRLKHQPRVLIFNRENQRFGVAHGNTYHIARHSPWNDRFVQ